MPTLKRFADCKIDLYANDHGVPHFHVLTPDGKVSVAIDTLQILAGNLPRRRLTEALAWAAKNRQRLLTCWNRLNAEE